ncbi:MAG: OmpA family protein [Planctomycetota bacterium]
MAKKKKKAEEEAPAGAPEWIVTFTDMISLLVTFFVLLMTFSSLDNRELLKVDSWLSRSDQMLQEKHGSVPQEVLRVERIVATDLRRGAVRPHVRPREELLDNIDEMGQKLTDEHIEVDLQEHPDGLVIEFGDETCFAPGSTELPDELKKSLIELGRVVEHYPYLVVIEGFTDGGFRPTATYDSAEAISCTRASKAAAYLLQETGMDPKMVQVSGLGATRPRADDETVEGRRLNRRVQARILSLSKVRAAHLEAVEREGRR